MSTTNPETINKLEAFKQRNNFSYERWNERGLNPSDDAMSTHLRSFFSNCTDRLITAVQKQASPWKLKSILKSELRSLNKWHYDTEEKEFIADLFYELASITEVRITDTLNGWLYGPFLVLLMKIMRILRPERILSTVSLPCTKCNIVLQLHILRKQEGVSGSWIIGKCSNCSEFNLLDHSPDAGMTRYENFHPSEHMPKDEYTHEQALTRLEQIKFFRK